MAMLFKATTIRTLIIVISIYAAGLAFFVYFQQHSLKKSYLQNIDIELREATNLARKEISDKQYIDFSGSTRIGISQDYALSEKLTEIATSRNLDFVYTMILRDGKIYFTSSSLTEEEVLGKESYKYTFLSTYDDASQKLYQVFDSGQPAFDEYTDRWGHFRTFFQPIYNGKDISYVIGADTSMAKVNAAVKASVLNSLALGLFLSLIALPLMYQFFRSIQKERDAEKIILYTDSESGLYNFNKLNDDLSEHKDSKLTLIDIENYNDTLNAIGPARTAHITQQFISRLQLFIEDNNFDVNIYRIDKHTFGLLTQSNISTFKPAVMKDLFSRLVKSGYGLSANKNIHLSIRMGAAANEKSLFVLANMALEKAKTTNKSIIFYNGKGNLPRTYINNITLTEVFHDALEQNRVTAFFQPIVDAKTAKIAKFECLARVVDQEGNIIQNPEQFMPIAYQSRLCHKVTRLMLKQSLETIKGTDNCISINISVSDLFDASTMHYICEKLDQSSQSKQIEFEILEHENIRDYNKAAAQILQLKKRGCRVGMDDLGKHYSNFDRLANLPLDFVKIDGGIVPYIEDDETALLIAKNIVALAKSKNLEIVAEYCINAKVYNAAVKLGIDYLQGFFIGMPQMNIDEIIRRHDDVKPELMQLCPILDNSRIVSP